jgi:hypothetical protein
LTIWKGDRQEILDDLVDDPAIRRKIVNQIVN